MFSILVGYAYGQYISVRLEKKSYHLVDLILGIILTHNKTAVTLQFITS